MKLCCHTFGGPCISQTVFDRTLNVYPLLEDISVTIKRKLYMAQSFLTKSISTITFLYPFLPL